MGEGGTGTAKGSSRKSWGDVNRVMNRLVAEGRIAGYRSNASDPERTGPLAIVLVPAANQDAEEARCEALRRLARLGIVAQMTCARDSAS